VSSQAEGWSAASSRTSATGVGTGQVLVELDREKLQYNLDQQKAALARSLARYGASEPGRLPPIDQTPDVKRAAAELNQAKRGFDRASELSKRQLLSQQALDDADAVLRTKQAEYDSALQNAATWPPTSTRRTRRPAGRAPAARRERPRPLRRLRAAAMVSLGELVKEQMPVMKIVRVDPLKVTAEIPEGLAPWVQSGQPVDLQVDAIRTGRSPARCRASARPSTSRRARSPFEALVPNPQGLLKPGTFVRVKLTTNHVEDLLTLPYAALQYRYGVNRAFVVTGDSITGREGEGGRSAGRSHRDPRRRQGGRRGRDDRRGQPRRRHEGGAQAEGELAPCSLNSASAGRSSPRCSSRRSWCSGSSRSATSASISSQGGSRHGERAAQLPGASPDEMTTSVVMPMENALSGIAGIDQLQANVQAGRLGQHHRALRARAQPRRRRQQRARKGGGRHAGGAARSAAAGHPEAGPRRRLDHDDRPGVEADDDPRAHRSRPTSR
jgi:hypothetical protein